MIIRRRLGWRQVATIAGRVIGLNAAWAALVYSLYAFGGLTILRVPFLPIATIGTAVAFYVGFKNNSAYDRFWEGRKIWGGVVNSSRTWAAAVLAYVEPGSDSETAKTERRALVYRQLAWINSLRVQLRKKSRFEDAPAPGTKKRLRRDAEHMRNDWDKEVSPFVEDDERSSLSKLANPATHMLVRQGTELARLVDAGRLDMFRQLELMKVIESLYTLQGKAERIKNTPFPRQYAEFSRWFTYVFVFFVPFGLLEIFADHVTHTGVSFASITAALPMVASSGLIAWVFMMMEGIGDASEDPFERSMNDVPMNALCRTIEIDLRSMLGETDLPPAEEAAAGTVLY